MARSVDERALRQSLVDHRLIQLAGGRLLALAPDAISAVFREHLATAAHTARVHSMAQLAAAAHITATLERAGIPAMQLKGPLMAWELHGDEGLRVSSDIDLLVAPADLDRAVELARALGWSVTDPNLDGLPRLHRVLRHPDSALPRIELHWRVHWYERRFAEEMLARSRLADGIRHIGPVDQFAALLLFYGRDGFVGLRLAADIAGWWDRHGGAAALADLGRHAAAYPELAETWRVALGVTNRLVGVPGEPSAAVRPRTRPGRLAGRLANWDLRDDPDQIMANVALVDGLLSPRGGFVDFLWRQVLPATGDDETAPRTPLHAVKVAARWAHAVSRVRGGRYWSPVGEAAVARGGAGQ
jgi:hypothetical protein